MNTSDSASSTRYNILWVFGDQHRGQAVGYMGDPNVHTPNIDTLADEGAFSTTAVAGCPLCCPFRGSLLSGQYPHKAVAGHQMPLPEGMPTVANAFDAAGYDTAWFGKWHIDGKREGVNDRNQVVPPDRRGGFRRWIGYENNVDPCCCHVHGHRSPGDQVQRYRLPGYETDSLTDLLLTFLHEKASPEGDRRPFFASLSVTPPHNRYVAPQAWMQRHTPGKIQLRPNVPDVARVTHLARRELAGYYAMIENLDWNLGRIRETLEQTGLADRTIIIFFSDHGDLHGSHGQFRKTAPWEEAIRIPFAVGGALRHPDRHGLNLPVNHVDFAPTSLGLCGITPPSAMAGTDYSAQLLGREPASAPPDSAFLQMVVPTGHEESVDRPWRGVVTNDGWKYICLEHQPWLLFNLNDDPYEQVNMAHNTWYARERKRLHDRLAAWISDTGDSFALPEL